MHNGRAMASCSRLFRLKAPLKFRTAAGAAGGLSTFPYMYTDTGPARNLFMKKRTRCM
ncbi:MAG: hypothetical protein JWN92_2933 [Candidatus Acidoferrum typicum]|nr:hypothetical protein [Candidatus Acidoferrum typicum]